MVAGLVRRGCLRGVGRLARHGVLPVAVTVAVSLLPFVPAQAAPKPSPAVARERSVPVSPVKPKQAAPAAMEVFEPQPVSWPTTGTAVVELPMAGDGSRRVAGGARVGGLPVTVAPGKAARGPADEAATPSRVSVRVMDRAAAGRAGYPLAVTVARADGRGEAGGVQVELDYSAFRHAYGADWDSRLGLVVVPECALTSPEMAECARAERVPVVNDYRAGVLRAEVELRPQVTAMSAKDAAATGIDDATLLESAGAQAVVALAAGESSSDTGDFSKTDLKASSQWTAGGSSADFSWSYPLAGPPVPGGLQPEVSLGYSSGSVDGLTAGENVQPSWLGEGWNYQPGFIERSYRPCWDDVSPSTPYWTGANTVPDACWRLNNARIAWNGRATEIIPGADGVWRLADDDGSKVELLSNTATDITLNYNNERWRVTTTDGTQYYFGQSLVPGTTTRTNSVQGQRVVANHSGDPCFSSASLSASNCAMAYRWNLDYVVDRHGNSMIYFYDKEFGSQRLIGSSTVSRTYDRAAVLNRIEYGLRAGSEATTTAPARMVFTAGDRCVTTSCATHDKANWPDTPWDLACSTSPCGPASFWSTKRLKSVQSQVWSGSGTTYNAVDQWDLVHQFPSTGNGTSPVLWLASITRTGKANGGSIAMPSITTGGVRFDQRADYDPNGTMAQPRKWRIASLSTETGGQIQVSYEGTDAGCQFGSPFPDPDNNTKRCFPQYYYPQQAPEGWSWWHKYIVKSVTEKDLVGGSPDVVHSYAYSTAGASTSVLWAHDDGAATWANKLEKRSWSDWRGYPTVTVTTGPATGPKSETKSLYFRGLKGDFTDTGENRASTITNSVGEVSQDDESRAGFLHEEITYAAPGVQPQAKTVWDPVEFQTGQRTLASTFAIPTVHRSSINRTAKERTWTLLNATSAWRTTTTVNTFESTYGLLTQVDDQGDTATADDDVCTRTWYTNNTTGGKHLIGLPNREETVAVNCSTTPVYPGHTAADIRYFYDGATTHGTAPTTGNVTKGEQVASFTGTTPNWVTTSTAGFDPWGRITSAGDALGRTTTTSYTQNTAGLTSQVTVTNAAQHDGTTVLDPAWGSPTSVTDANDKVTTAAYDALGRLTKVWRPGRDTGLTPNAEFAYSVTKSAPSWVSSKELGPNGNQISSFEIYDGMLRPRQTQTTAPDSKRVITDAQYDGRGLTAKTSTFYNNASGPTSVLVAFADSNVETQHRVSYDGLERPIIDALWSLNTFKQQSTTSYGGDRINVEPPDGGTPTTSISDARGRQSALRQHTAPSISFLARANNRYVTAQNTGTGPLLADRAAIGQWEEFDVIDAGNGFVGLRSHANGKYVSAESGGAQPLIANRTTVGPWEMFKLITNSDGTVSLQANANGLYVTAESAGAQPLIASRTTIGPWEKFDKLLGHTPTGDYDETRYSHDRLNRLTAVTDPAGNDWTYSYDLLGRKTQAIDPDAGTTFTEFHDNSTLTKATTDARGKRLYYTYDDLNRRTEAREDSAAGRLVAKWTYDTIVKGQPASSTRYDTDGLAYTTSVGSYDDAYRPESTSLTIPASTANGALAGTYTTSTTYKVNGAPATVSLPGVGGLPAETLTYGYAPSGASTTLSSAQGTYVYNTNYGYDGQVSQLILGTTGKQVRLTSTFDPATRRLATAQVDTESQTTAGTWDDKFTTEYGYKPNGLIYAIAGKTNGSRDQVECFTYDRQQRLVEAWTESSWNCATPQRAGADPYWRQWTFDTIGNRLTQTDKDPGGDTTWIYTNPAAGQPRPHTLTSIAATGPKAGTATRSFTYDNSGNTLTRTTETGANQTLTWDAEGHLVTLTEGSQTTSYLYDAEGSRLIARAPGKTTLYLGNTELVLPTGSNQPDGTRYYHGYAVRDITGLKWTANNHQGTGQIQIDAGTLASERRRTMPYGEDRGTAPTPWLGTKGFVGGTKDDTSLTHLGAREYDPTVGRFISIDPIMDPASPQQMHGYAYANNSPINLSDPSGLFATGDNEGQLRDYSPGPKKHKIVDHRPPKKKSVQPPPPKKPANVPTIPAKKAQQLREYINMVAKQNPETWHVAGSDANNAIMVRVRNAVYGSPGWEEYWEALDGVAVSTVVATIGAILCPASAGASCLLAVGALAGVAGQCMDDCADAQTLALAAVLGAVSGGGPKTIALGRRETVGSFADSVGAKSLMAQNPGEWQVSVLAGAYNPNTRFAVNLDGIEGIGDTIARGKYRELKQDIAINGQKPSWFDWEMYVLDQAGAWDRVTFYSGGKIVENPFGR